MHIFVVCLSYANAIDGTHLTYLHATNSVPIIPGSLAMGPISGLLLGITFGYSDAGAGVLFFRLATVIF